MTKEQNEIELLSRFSRLKEIRQRSESQFLSELSDILSEGVTDAWHLASREFPNVRLRDLPSQQARPAVCFDVLPSALAAL